MTKKDGRLKVAENEKGKKKANSLPLMDLLTPSGSAFAARKDAKRELEQSVKPRESSRVRSKDYISPHVSLKAVQVSLRQSVNSSFRKSKQEKYRSDDTQEKVTQSPYLTFERVAELMKKKSGITKKKTSDGAGSVLTPRLK